MGNWVAAVEARPFLVLDVLALQVPHEKRLEHLHTQVNIWFVESHIFMIDRHKYA
jgi:hypothetical protein